MMRKTMATVLMIFAFAIGGNASATIKAVPEFTTWLGTNYNQNLLRDTSFIPSPTDDLKFSHQNLLHKKRLDSLQRNVPLPYNDYVQSYIDIYSGRKEQISKLIGLSKYYFPIFGKALIENGIPEEIKYLSIVESALNPNAVSQVGATGPWQFMYTTAKGYGLNIDNYVDERRDPVKASYAAAAYFRDAYNEFGDWLLAIAAYNCGKGSVSRAIEKAGGEMDFWAIRQYLPAETRNYVPAYIAITYVMNNYAKYGIYPGVANFSIFTDNISVSRHVSLVTIAKATNIDVDQLCTLNPSYIKQIINGSANEPKSLIIPSLGKEFYTSLYAALNNSSTNGEVDFIQAGSNLIVPENDLSKKPLTYTVKAGDILADISDVFKLEVQDLKVWNKLPSYQVVPGQILRLTPPSKSYVSKNNSASSEYVIYKVRSGETLSDIAEKFEGISISDIKSINGLKGAVVQPGQVLKISKG